MNMHLEINALACDSILATTLNSKCLASAAPSCFHSVKRRLVCALATPRRAGFISRRPRAGVPHLAYRGGFSPGSVKLDWKLNSARGLAAAEGIRKFLCEERESRRGEASASCITSVAQHQCRVQRRLPSPPLEEAARPSHQAAARRCR